ncbi:MAG: FGGY family carbohydrate kinase, partial [Pseudomonadota bacterium]
MADHVLAIDQGTTSSRAILFDAGMRPVASGQEEFEQHFPRSGWVEHEQADLWSSTAAVCRAAIERAEIGPNEIAAVGITNQRETVCVWEKETGRQVHRAVVWQDRRTSEMAARLRDA